MKICAAQTKPVTGDMEANIAGHKRLIDLAIASGADMIIFPELSLTGYEPGLAATLATVPQDSRFDDFRQISDRNNITIGVGAPIRADAGICISMLLFLPGQPSKIYSKKYIHEDEKPFFIPGKNFSILRTMDTNIALAICYELSVPEHAKTAFEQGADMYIASVAKFAPDVENANRRLPEIAQKYAVPVMMANSVGPADNGMCAGQTAAWNSKGLLIGQLDNSMEGILLFDTSTQQLQKKQTQSSQYQP